MSGTKPAGKRNLTVKQAKFVKAKAEGLTGVEAVKQAYGIDNYNLAAVMASENLRKPNINEAVQAEMARQGLTLETIITPVREALTATKVNIVRDPAGGEESAFAEETPDHSVRLKAVTIASQFMGIGKQQAEGGPSLHFHNHMNTQKDDYGL